MLSFAIDALAKEERILQKILSAYLPYTLGVKVFLQMTFKVSLTLLLSSPIMIIV